MVISNLLGIKRVSQDKCISGISRCSSVWSVFFVVSRQKSELLFLTCTFNY
jgi:hypothetical protein